VEKSHLGGICLNWGCIPTKALLRSADVYHSMLHAKDFGLSAKEVSFDLAAVVKRSRGVSAQLTQGVGFLLKKNKVDVIWGAATLKGKGRNLGRRQREPSQRARWGAGTIPPSTHRGNRRTPPARSRAWNRTRSSSGPISKPWSPTSCRNRCWSSAPAPLASSSPPFFRTMGAEVTVVELLPQVLPVEDHEIAAHARSALRSRASRSTPRPRSPSSTRAPTT
jgi:dihydrolipoamide dehydrogenase